MSIAAAACGLAALALAQAPDPGGNQVTGPRSATAEPLAPRGGVLMIPLAAERPGSGWPRRLDLVLDDGRTVPGLVAWVHAAEPPARHRWTDDPRALAVRPIEPQDDTASQGSGAPYLLAELPGDAQGAMTLNGQRLEPRWLDVPPAPELPPGAEAMTLAPAPDRPDPDSPFEYWRWVLLAERLGLAPPSPDAFGAAGSLVARHYAALWRAGMARLAQANRRVHARCLGRLTGIGRDGPEAFAAWVVEPAIVSRLLAVVLDAGRSEREMVLAASAWADEARLIAVRIAPADPLKVAVATVNMDEAPLDIQLRWPGGGPQATRRLPPGLMERVELARPETEADAAAGPPPMFAADVQIMEIEAAGSVRRLTFPTGAVAARPPGVRFSLRPFLTLADAQSGRQRGARPDRATNVELRRVEGRWEVFVECLRPTGRAAPAGRGDEPGPSGVTATRGVEAVMLLFGGEPARAILAVPERGPHRLFRGADSPDLEVHRGAYADRWYCRVVVPDAWLAGQALLGAVRTHGGAAAVETGPYASLPWHLEPGRAVIDLSAWD